MTVSPDFREVAHVPTQAELWQDTSDKIAATQRAQEAFRDLITAIVKETGSLPSGSLRTEAEDTA